MFPVLRQGVRRAVEGAFRRGFTIRCVRAVCTRLHVCLMLNENGLTCLLRRLLITSVVRLDSQGNVKTTTSNVTRACFLTRSRVINFRGAILLDRSERRVLVGLGARGCSRRARRVDGNRTYGLECTSVLAGWLPGRVRGLGVYS